jgi:hypothetical protein
MANDLVFWNTQLIMGDLAEQTTKLRQSKATFVSKPGATPAAQIVRDPDGHAFTIQADSQSTMAKGRR